MEWFRVEEASFYALAWTLAFLVSLFRSLGSSDSHQPFSVCLFSSGVAGFFSFSIISFLVGRDELSFHWYYLGLATLIGLAGPINQQMILGLLSRFGVNVSASESNNTLDDPGANDSVRDRQRRDG